MKGGGGMWWFFGRFGVELSGLGRGLVGSYQVSAFLVELELGRKDLIFKKEALHWSLAALMAPLTIFRILNSKDEGYSQACSATVAPVKPEK